MQKPIQARQKKSPLTKRRGGQGLKAQNLAFNEKRCVVPKKP